MRKIEFKIKKIELVKGCPTDINGNGYEDDDFNNDGNVDQNDQDYYDGYMSGYIDGYVNDDEFGFGGPEEGQSPAYYAGYEDGELDGEGDTVHDPEINHEGFQAPPDYCPPY